MIFVYKHCDECIGICKCGLLFCTFFIRVSIWSLSHCPPSSCDYDFISIRLNQVWVFVSWARFVSKSISVKCHRTLHVIGYHWFRWYFGAVEQPVNADLYPCHHVASLCQNVLNNMRVVQLNSFMLSHNASIIIHNPISSFILDA